MQYAPGGMPRTVPNSTVPARGRQLGRVREDHDN
jgi:hypothetical protein